MCTSAHNRTELSTGCACNNHCRCKLVNFMKGLNINSWVAKYARKFNKAAIHFNKKTGYKRKPKTHKDSDTWNL